MKTIQYFTPFLLALIIMASISCSNTKKNSEKSDQTVAEKVINEQDIKPDIQKILYEFPTPFEVTIMLNKAKAAFIFDLTNPVENVGKYESENSRALFLGIYSADLSYASAYNMADEIESLLECTGSLTDKLGIAGIYNENIIGDIKRNYNEQDSLVTIITKIFGDTKDILSEANRDKTSFLIAAGGFIESLYIAANLNYLAQENTEISDIIVKQKENLDKLSSVFSVLPQDEDTRTLKDSFNKLDAFFNELNLEEGKGLNEEQSGALKDILDEARATLAA